MLRLLLLPTLLLFSFSILALDSSNSNRKKRSAPQVRIACYKCRYKHRKCDDNNPCLNCSQNGDMCERATIKRKKNNGKENQAEITRYEDENTNNEVENTRFSYSSPCSDSAYGNIKPAYENVPKIINLIPPPEEPIITQIIYLDEPLARDFPSQIPMDETDLRIVSNNSATSSRTDTQKDDTLDEIDKYLNF